MFVLKKVTIRALQDGVADAGSASKAVGKEGDGAMGGEGIREWERECREREAKCENKKL